MNSDGVEIKFKFRKKIQNENDDIDQKNKT
jgi:hypothetical protein